MTLDGINMILNGQEIEKFVDEGHLLNSDKTLINSGSIDLRINSDIKILNEYNTVDLSEGEKPSYREYDMVQNDGKFLFKPGQKILCSTIEEFNLPDNVCTDIRLRSSVARCFIDHLFASWADAGFNGANLTLEFVNHSSNIYILKPGMRLVQLIMYRTNPVDDKYNYRHKGRYNQQKGTIGSKGI